MFEYFKMDNIICFVIANLQLQVVAKQQFFKNFSNIEAISSELLGNLTITFPSLVVLVSESKINYCMGIIIIISRQEKVK